MRHRIVVILGVLIALLCIPHAFIGLPDLWRQLTAAGVDADLRGALAVGWSFGSLTMLTLGLVVIWCGLDGGALARRCALTVGVAYMAFGVGATLYHGFGPHLLAFFLIGLSLSGVTARWRTN